MNYFTQSLETSQQAETTLANYRLEFDSRYRINRVEMLLALGAGFIGACMDMFCLTNVHKLSNEKLIGFKPDAQIKHLRESGLINNKVSAILNKFHNSELVKWLEWKCKVPYDKTAGTGILGLIPQNHRLLTPGHDPLLGLYYGTKDILKGEFTVTDNSATMYVLQNSHGQQANLFLAFMKQIGHLLSDAGSSTSLPFPGLWIMSSIKGVSPVNDYTWNMLSKEMYYKGFTLDHLMACSVPLLFANLTLITSELIYGLALRRRGEFTPLDDKEVFINRIKTMRTIAYAIMVGSNLAKCTLTHGNIFAANIPLYAAFLKGGYDQFNQYYRMEEKRHEYVMRQIDSRREESKARFDKLLLYGSK